MLTLERLMRKRLAKREPLIDLEPYRKDSFYHSLITFCL